MSYYSNHTKCLLEVDLWEHGALTLAEVIQHDECWRHTIEITKEVEVFCFL